MKAINLNSSIMISDDTEIFAMGRLGFLGELWHRLPVYLVNEELMDYLYPPHKRLGLDEECLKSLIRDNNHNNHNGNFYDEEAIIRDNQRFWNLASECCRELKDLMIDVGLYCRSLGLDQLSIIKQQSGIVLNPSAAIFICPERVGKWTDYVLMGFPKYKGSTIFNIIYSKVLFHELTHGFMDSHYKIKIKGCSKLLEESMCNAIAYSRFSIRERAIMAYAANSQPLEYRAYIHWVEFRNISLREMAKAWRDNDVRHHIRNYIIGFDYYNDRFKPESDFIDRFLRYEVSMLERYPELYWKIVGRRIIEEVISRI